MIEHKKLLQSISYWLSYQEKIGRSFMITEASLRYPVADYLSSTALPLDEIKLEYPHPYLQQRRIDLVTLRPVDKGHTITAAMEFKVVKDTTKSTAEKKRIFNDLVRLHLLAQAGLALPYFVVAGKFDQFIYNFRSTLKTNKLGGYHRLPDPSGFFTEWFSFSPRGTRTFAVGTQNDAVYRPIYDAFWQDYRERDIPAHLPGEISTECIAISPLSRDFPLPYVGGIWKIN